MERYPDKAHAAIYDKVLGLTVEQKKAGYSAWYELFPRSWGSEPGKHGNFNDCRRQLPMIAGMGFDVLYLPPIHPIGYTKRKGKNNALVAAPGEPGSCWAIGNSDGGHKAVHPELGTLEDFAAFVAEAERLGISVALDIAFQCSPDHPYVQEHPQWFTWRPDGTVQFAENPPKRYEDILPINFESADWQNLWIELKSIFLFWIGKGVKIFRVDNPHTKAFPFWEWAIASIREEYPDTVFLAEAFTRPKLMARLAKVGYSQSYSYFTWRNTKQELQQYVSELTSAPLKHFMRANFWPNTPDILHEELQKGDGRSSLSVWFWPQRFLQTTACMVRHTSFVKTCRLEKARRSILILKNMRSKRGISIGLAISVRKLPASTGSGKRMRLSSRLQTSPLCASKPLRAMNTIS